MDRSLNSGRMDQPT